MNTTYTNSQYVDEIHRVVAEHNSNTFMRCLVVLASSVMVALVSTYLISHGRLGLDFTLSIWLCLGTFVGIKIYFKENIGRPNIYLLTAAVVFSLGFVLRSSWVLHCLNILAVLILCCLTFAKSQFRNIWNVTITKWVCTPFFILKSVFSSVFLLATNSVLLPNIDLSYKKDITSILIGFFVSLPFIFIFGALLVASDTRFEYVIDSLFRFDITTFFSWAWEYILSLSLVSAFFYSSLLQGASHIDEHAKESDSKQKVEGMLLITVLACISALFILYITVQLSYFFGGDTLVIDTEGLTYSSYARQGFWELVWIAIIALPFLYYAQWLQRKSSASLQLWFGRFATLLLGSILVIECSAMYKMFLYIKAYGLTELRFYSTAFMIFLIISLILFRLLVLKEKPHRYLPSLLCSALFMIAALNIINPNRLITQYNVNNIPAGWLVQTNANYHGVDAFPYIFTTGKIGNLNCFEIENYEKILEKPRNWRKWRFADWRAHNAVNQWKINNCVQK